jgi:hypothetical protein
MNKIIKLIILIFALIGILSSIGITFTMYKYYSLRPNEKKIVKIVFKGVYLTIKFTDILIDHYRKMILKNKPVVDQIIEKIEKKIDYNQLIDKGKKIKENVKKIWNLFKKKKN